MNLNKHKLVLVLLLATFILGFVRFNIPKVKATSTKILSSGDNLIHGFIYYDGYLWGSTRTTPARVLKINPETLDYERITLDSGLNYGEDIEAAENYVWVVLRISPTKLIKVNPTTLSWETAITFSGFDEGQSLVYAFNYLWIGGMSKIAKVNLTSLSYTLYDYSGLVGIRDFHAITSGGSYIWATTELQYSEINILKINSSNPTGYSYVNLTKTISDDITYVDNHLFCGSEFGIPRVIWKIANDLTHTNVSIGSDGCYGVFSHGGELYALINVSPGTVQNYLTDLSLNTVYGLPIGFNKANEVAWDDDGVMYVTCFTSPSRIVKFKPFVFHGLLDENIGELKPPGQRAVNVTAYFGEDISSVTFEVNGTYIYNYTVPLYFHFELGSEDREYWLSGDEGYNIYIFNATFTTYTINFLDLAGALDDNPIVKAQRLINGSLMTVEKRKVDVEKKVQFSLVQGCKYTIIIQDGASYTFGALLMTSQTTIQLTLKGIAFPKETLMTSKYVRIYALRVFDDPNGTITITYEDLLNMTTSVKIEINYKNGTNVYTDTETTSSFNHEWANAMNDTDYALVCTINHQRYGVYVWKNYYPQEGSSIMPWGLDWFGTLPFNTAYIIPAILILFAGGCFSQINAEVGAFAMVVVAIIIAYMGWLPITGSILMVAFALMILMGIVAAKRRIKT